MTTFAGLLVIARLEPRQTGQKPTFAIRRQLIAIACNPFDEF
jgi:hypothetical protein